MHRRVVHTDFWGVRVGLFEPQRAGHNANIAGDGTETLYPSLILGLCSETAVETGESASPIC